MFSVLQWNGNEKVKAQTEHGVAMAVFQDKLAMVYIGASDKNMWMATMTSIGEPPVVAENKQITIDRVSSPKSRWRPALATDGKLLHCVYSGLGDVFVYWSWFDGANWHGNLKLPTLPRGSGGASHQYELSLAFYDGKIHCVAVLPFTWNTPNTLMYYSYYVPGTPLTGGSWALWTAIDSGQDMTAPSLTVINNQLVLAASDGVAPLTVNGPAVAPIDWYPQPFGFDSNVGSSEGYALLPWGDATGAFLAYRAGNGNDLYYAYFTPYPLPNGNVVLQGNIRIKCPTSHPETSAPLGGAFFDGAFVLAYKGKSSDNFYIAYARTG